MPKRKSDPRQAALGIEPTALTATPARKVVLLKGRHNRAKLKDDGTAMWAGKTRRRRRMPPPSEAEMRAAMEAFAARGGRVTVCPARCVAVVNGGAGIC
jgi:hypothetical protein